MTAQSETPNTNEPLEGQLVETREQVWERKEQRLIPHR